MEARLILLDPPAARREVKLSLPTTIGRSRDATIKLVHGQVSRVHCEFFERDGVLHVRDLGSTNGTYVGDDRVDESAVPPGETVTIGAVRFRAEYEPAEDAILPAMVQEPTTTVRKATEATFRAQAAVVPPATKAPYELEALDQAEVDDTLVNQPALKSTAIPPVLPATQGADDAPPPPLVDAQSQNDAAAPRPVEWEELEELELAPLEGEETAAIRPEAPSIGDESPSDDSLHIFPPSDEPAAGQPPPELQWRVPEPSSPAASGFAPHVDEPDLEPPEPLPNAPSQAAKNDDDSFEEFLRSLEEDDKPA
jgi:pSer/pThr/pTyr-binding forkhead associated (FHA) protein